MPLDAHSYKLGVVVSLQIRLFDAAFERLAAIRPTVGPADLEPRTPLFREEGSPGEDGYRRIWTLEEPKGASATARGIAEGFLKAGSAAKMEGFELPPLPDASEPAAEGASAIEGRGPVLLGASGDERVAFLDVIPTKVRWRNNAPRVPDELEIDLPLAAFPVPPDGSLVRSILVEMRRTLLDADGQPVGPASDDPDFAGFATKHGIRLSSGSASRVTLPCQDFAGVAADTQCRGRMLETDMPADEAIARFLSLFPFAVGLEVVWLGPLLPPEIGALGPRAKRQKLSKKGKPTRPPKTPRQSVLDAISDYCTLAAVTPRWVGYRLELGPARTLNRDQADAVPRMVLGENVEELELDHRLAHSATRAIEVRSFNPDTGQIVVGRFPDDPALYGELAAGAANKAAPTGPLEVPPGASAVEEKGPTVQTVYGVTDPKQLQLIAENIFNELARQDLSGKLKTKDIATIEGRAKGVADLLELRAGDPLGVAIAPSIEEANGSFIQRLATLAAAARANFEDPLVAATDYLVGELGYKPAIAKRVASGVISVDRPFTYRVREIEFTWGVDQPTQFDITLMNFIESLEEQVPQKGGARRRLMLHGGGSFSEKWAAIDADMLSGELSAADALRLQKQVGEEERLSRGITRTTTITKSALSPTKGATVAKAPGKPAAGSKAATPFAFSFKL